MADLRRMLDDAAGRTAVPGPQTIRRRSDSRRRSHRALTVVGCVAVVAAAFGLHAGVAGPVRTPAAGSPCASSASTGGSSRLPVSAALTADELGPHWYPGTAPAAPVTGIPGVPSRLGGSPTTELLRGGSATVWHIRETAARLPGDGAARVMQHVRAAAACGAGLSIASDRRTGSTETLLLRTGTGPGFTVVGRTGPYVLLLDVRSSGPQPITAIAGPAWIAWLAAAAVAKVGSVTGVSGVPAAGARPPVTVPTVAALPGLLAPSDLAGSWFVANAPSDARTRSTVPLWGTCDGRPQTARQAIYLTDDPRTRVTVVEQLNYYPAGAGAVPAAVVASPCAGGRVVAGGLPSRPDVVVLAQTSATVAVFTLRGVTVGLSVSGPAPGSNQAVAQLDRVARGVLSSVGGGP